MLHLNLSDIAIITVKGIDYCCITDDISKSEAIYLLEKCAWRSSVYVTSKTQACFDTVCAVWAPKKIHPNNISSTFLRSSFSTFSTF